MSTLEASHTVMGVMPSVVPTGVTEELSLTGPNQQRQENRTRWQAVIDERLMEWLKDPSALEDDDLQPPTPAAIHVACRIAMQLRDEGQPAPLRVVPNGDGGIAFEYRVGSVFMTIEIEDAGPAEATVFVDGKLQFRMPVG